MTIRRSTEYHPQYGRLRSTTTTDGSRPGTRQCAFDVWSRLSDTRMAVPDPAEPREAHILRGFE